jgi:hypothetical protein
MICRNMGGQSGGAAEGSGSRWFLNPTSPCNVIVSGCTNPVDIPSHRQLKGVHAFPRRPQRQQLPQHNPETAQLSVSVAVSTASAIIVEVMAVVVVVIMITIMTNDVCHHLIIISCSNSVHAHL